jgi:hypothetical protein
MARCLGTVICAYAKDPKEERVMKSYNVVDKLKLDYNAILCQDHGMDLYHRIVQILMEDV